MKTALELMDFRLALLVPFLRGFLHRLLQLMSAKKRVEILSLKTQNRAARSSGDDMALSLAIMQKGGLPKKVAFAQLSYINLFALKKDDQTCRRA